MTERRLAETMHRLMTEVLGYPRYLTYGEDVSANVNDLIAASYPEPVAGILVTHSHFPEHGRAGKPSPRRTSGLSSNAWPPCTGPTARTGTFRRPGPTRSQQP